MMLMTTDRVIELIMHELVAAEKKHPGWPDDNIHRAAILAEEAGECVKEAINYEYGNNPLDRDRAYHAMIKEAAQTGAMAIRLLRNMTEIDE